MCHHSTFPTLGNANRTPFQSFSQKKLNLPASDQWKTSHKKTINALESICEELFIIPFTSYHWKENEATDKFTDWPKDFTFKFVWINFSPVWGTGSFMLLKHHLPLSSKHPYEWLGKRGRNTGESSTSGAGAAAAAWSCCCSLELSNGGGWRKWPGIPFLLLPLTLLRCQATWALVPLPPSCKNRVYQDSANSASSSKVQNIVSATRGDHLSMAGDLLLLHVRHRAAMARTSTRTRLHRRGNFRQDLRSLESPQFAEHYRVIPSWLQRSDFLAYDVKTSYL